MGVIEKIKLIMKGIKPVGQFVKQIKGAKLKWKTIPFWTALLLSGTSIVAVFQGFIPGSVAIIVTSVLTAGYNILRGLDKMDQTGIKPTLLSTEFWMGALAIISTSLLEIQHAGIDSKLLAGAITFIATAMSIAQQLGAVQPKGIPPALEPKGQ